MLFSHKAADDTDRVRVLISGLTREDDVVTAVEAGADAVGFVCYPGNFRYVTPSRLMSLTSLVPDSVTTVLLFINPTAEEVREHLVLFPHAVLQFYGNESRAFCDQFHVPYIKVVKADNFEDVLMAQDEFPMARGIVAMLTETAWNPVGQDFDWESVHNMRSRVRKPLVIAGGLKEQSVAYAIKMLTPWAVEVASGVETARGIKDHGKIAGFMDAVHRGGEVDPNEIDGDEDC